MALYKYFKPDKGGNHECPLPDPEGPLSSKIPCSSVEAANKEVRPVLQNEASGIAKKRGQYKHYTAKEKARVAKKGAEYRVRHFAAEFSERPLNESTVRVWHR